MLQIPGLGCHDCRSPASWVLLGLALSRFASTFVSTVAPVQRAKWPWHEAESKAGDIATSIDVVFLCADSDKVNPCKYCSHLVTVVDISSK